MNSQLQAKAPFKRFANASLAEVYKIRELRHEESTKKQTKWAVNLFQGEISICSVSDSYQLTFYRP